MLHLQHTIAVNCTQALSSPALEGCHLSPLPQLRTRHARPQELSSPPKTDNCHSHPAQSMPAVWALVHVHGTSTSTRTPAANFLSLGSPERQSERLASDADTHPVAAPGEANLVVRPVVARQSPTHATACLRPSFPKSARACNNIRAKRQYKL